MSRPKGKNQKFKGGQREARLDSPVVIGRNGVREIVQRFPERVREVLFVGADSLKEAVPTGASVRTRAIDKDDLSDLVGSTSHQGVAALLTERIYFLPEDFIDRDGANERSIVVALDDISDPHNFGAIIRAAECFGVQGVLFSKNRGAGITPTVTKVSGGATELVSLIRVANLAESLVKFQKADYQIITLEVGVKAEEIHKAELGNKIVIVAGSEHDGVQSLISKRADKAVYVPMHGSIDSLNVSQAVAVVLSEIRRRWV